METLGRNIFLTGEYIAHFAPEDRKNPFRKIYQRKKEDTVEIIHGISLKKSPKRILDVGGGMGRLALQLSICQPGMVVLTDISIDMLAMAENRKGSATMSSVNADAQRLPFMDNSFDIVTGLDLFCHLEKPEWALAEFRRVLTDDGTLILDSTNNNPIWALFYPRYIGLNPVRWLKIIRFGGVLPGWEKIVRHYSRNTFTGFLHDAGFKLSEIRSFGPGICPKWHLAICRKNQPAGS